MNCSTTDQMQLTVGTLLGPYEITAPLGAGGMGEVYKARDTRLERMVAVKVLPADKVADPARKQRFIQEARAASALNHPNIVTLHDISQEGGIDFLVMEYVPGKTLEHLIPRKGLRLSDTLKYAVQIADALAAAHSAGIVQTLFITIRRRTISAVCMRAGSIPPQRSRSAMHSPSATFTATSALPMELPQGTA